MKTHKYVAILLAFFGLLLFGCSDQATQPVSPTDQSVQGSVGLAKKDVVNFITYNFPVAPSTGGTTWETPGGIWHVKDKEVHEGIITKYEDGTKELGSSINILSMTLDAEGEGPVHGSFTMTMQGGGVWKGTYTGYRSYAPPAPAFPTDPDFPSLPFPSTYFVFEAPLKIVANGTGGNIDGKKLSGVCIIRTFGIPSAYYYGITVGSYE